MKYILFLFSCIALALFIFYNSLTLIVKYNSLLVGNSGFNIYYLGEPYTGKLVRDLPIGNNIVLFDVQYGVPSFFPQPRLIRFRMHIPIINEDILWLNDGKFYHLRNY